MFIAVGTNLEITVNPDLPKGLKLDCKTGEIYGLITKYVDKRNYTFVIKNPPSTVVETVKVEIELNIIYIVNLILDFLNQQLIKEEERFQ